MKQFNKFIGYCALAIPLMTACTDSFDSMNTNPAAALDVSPAYTLPSVIEWATMMLGLWQAFGTLISVH